MYLLQARRLKRKLPPWPGFRLPSLEWLEKVNSRVIILSAILVGVGFLAGMILNTIGAAPGAIPWSDPVIWTSALMFGWLLTAAIFNAVYRPARRGRKVAYLTVASFGFLAVALSVFFLVDTQHGAGNRRQQPEPPLAARIPGSTGILPVHRSTPALATARPATLGARRFAPGGRP
jgi:hypothetical protein